MKFLLSIVFLFSASAFATQKTETMNFTYHHWFRICNNSGKKCQEHKLTNVQKTLKLICWDATKQCSSNGIDNGPDLKMTVAGYEITSIIQVLKMRDEQNICPGGSGLYYQIHMNYSIYHPNQPGNAVDNGGTSAYVCDGKLPLLYYTGGRSLSVTPGAFDHLNFTSSTANISITPDL